MATVSYTISWDVTVSARSSLVIRHLHNDVHLVYEKRIQRLMRLMGLVPIYQKPNTSRPAKGHKT